MQIQNALITGSFSYNGADLSNITSSNAYSASLSIRTTNLESTSSVLVGASSSFSSILTSVSSSQQQISASLLTLTASYNALSSSYIALSASYNVYSSSVSTRITENSSSIQQVSSSLLQVSASYISLSASYTTFSGSASTRISNNETASNNLTNASASFSTRITSDSSSLSSRTTQVEKTYATTGSNTYTGTQNFSSTCTPNGFNSGASIYTAGGLQVTNDAYFSSSVFIKGNVTVYGTQSVAYISSSQLNIGTNTITVNTFTPSVRFGGLSVFDSGSTGLTGSIFWDSELNRWIYVNASGSGGGATYGGGMFISGPRNSVGLGCEQGTTACMLLVGQGGDHLTSSMIYHSSTVTCFGTTSTIDSAGVYSGTCIIASSKIVVGGTSGDIGADLLRVKGTIITDNNAGYLGYSSAGNRFELAKISSGDEIVLGASNSPGAVALISGTGQDLILRSNGTCERIRITSAGNVGIGTNSPATYSGYTTLAINNATNGAVLDFLSNGTRVASINNGPSSFDIETKTAAPMAFATTNTERMRITSTGIACFACQVCAPSIISSGTICSAGNATIASCLGIGTNSPSSYCHGGSNRVAEIFNSDNSANSQSHIILSTGASTIPGAIGSVTWVVPNSSAANKMGSYIGADIEANSSTAVCTNIFLASRNNEASPQVRLRIASSGIACFACQVCVGGMVALNNTSFGGPATEAAFRIRMADNGGINNDPGIGLDGAGSGSERMWFNALSGHYFNNGTNGIKLNIDSAGIACFACRVCTPSLTVGGTIITTVSPGAYEACINYLGTTYSFGSGETVDSVDFKICGASASTTGNRFGFWTQAGNATPVERLRIDKNGIACFACQVCAPTLIAGSGGIRSSNNIIFPANLTTFTIWNEGYGGAVQLRRSDVDTDRYARIGIVDNSGNWVAGMTINGSNSNAEFGAGVCAASYVCATGGVIFASTNIRVSTGTAAGNSSDPAITTGGCTKTGIYFAGSCVGLGSGGNGVLLNAGGTLFPAANGSQDLGSSSNRWCTVYTSDLSLNNGIGNYTIVEGENDLFLYNNNSCKVFKFIVQEVCPEIAPAKRST